MMRSGEFHEGEVLELNSQESFSRCHFYNCEFIGSGITFIECVFVGSRPSGQSFVGCLFDTQNATIRS